MAMKLRRHIDTVRVLVNACKERHGRQAAELGVALQLLQLQVQDLDRSGGGVEPLAKEALEVGES